MKRLSLQWRITLLTVLLIGAACVSMKLLLCASGLHYMDSIGSFIQDYGSAAVEGDPAFFDPELAGMNEDVTIVIHGAKTSFCTTNWYITAAVTVLSGVLAYFVSGRALRPLRSCPSKNLSDVPAPDNWAHAGIDFCVRTGLMSGVGSGRFDPKGTTTRAQAVQVLYELSGAPKVSGKTPFTDLTHGWYQSAVLWAYQTGVTSGVSETTFAPDTPVTREQVAVFLARFADRVLDKYTPYMWDALFPFQDRESISYYARTAMNWACNLGLIKGIPCPGGLRLEPQSSATREQMAVMIARFCRRLNVWNEPIPEL